MTECVVRKTKFTTAAKLFFNVPTVGFWVGLYTHQNTKCSWEQGFRQEVNVFTYFLGSYFTLHVVTWYIIFSFLYQYIFSIGLYYISMQLFGVRYEKLVKLLVQLTYGFWAAGEILGGWCDLERIKECIQTQEETCDSTVIRKLTAMTQAMCESFTRQYDEDLDAYVVNHDNWCVFSFKYLGHGIMTIISTLFTIIVFTVGLRMS